MPENNQNIVALIPARGGSKGVKNKNIKTLNHKPLITYSIEAALSCKTIDRVIVSTNDKSIAKIAKEAGAEVPFLRPDDLATDTTPDRPVMLHLIDWLKENEHYKTDLLVYLRPTSPFKTSILINNCIKRISGQDWASSLRTVTKSEGIFHPYWMYKSENEQLKPFIEGVSIEKYYQRQLLPDCFRLNGVVDILKPQLIKSSNNIYGNKISYFEIDENQAIDIDTELDFQFADFLIKNEKT